MNALRFTPLFLFRVVTAPLLVIYLVAIYLRRLAYKKGIFSSIDLPGFTIAVGNIEAGGTGKTPVVAALARIVRERGGRPVIVTRGYRSGLKRSDSMVLVGRQILLHPLHAGKYHADEAFMQADLLDDVPVIIGRCRAQAVKRYLQSFPVPTHFILDDGFQHLAIRRQTDIVLLDARAPFGNGFVFPWGRLRERPQSLARATLVLLTREEGETRAVRGAHDFLRRMEKPVAGVRFHNDPPAHLAGPAVEYGSLQRIAVVTAIAKPLPILSYPLQKGQIVAAQVIRRDHSRFNRKEIEAAAGKAEAILTTAKDFYRDPAVFEALHLPVFMLPLRVDLPHDFLVPWLGF